MAGPKSAPASEDAQEPPHQLNPRHSTASKGDGALGSMRYAVAGLCSGFVSCLMLHPLDVVNTRLQAHDGKMTHLPKYSGTAHALTSIVRDDGVGALYAGLAPNLLGQTASWGCFFWTHARLKGMVRAAKEEGFAQDSRGLYRAELSFGERLGCSAGAGVVTATATQPVWVVKTRLQLQTTRHAHYTGMLDVAQRIAHEEGSHGLWRGLVPSLCLVSNIALQMFLYEELLSRLRVKMESGSVSVEGWHSFVCGAAAKVCACCTTYPLQVIRTRLQQRDPSLLSSSSSSSTTTKPATRHYTGVLDVVGKTVAGEGVRGLYKGLSTNLVRVVPGAAITFTVYEAVKNNL